MTDNKRGRKPFAVIRNQTISGKPIIEGVAKLLRGLGECRREDNAFDQTGIYEVRFVREEFNAIYQRVVHSTDIYPTLAAAQEAVARETLGQSVTP